MCSVLSFRPKRLFVVNISELKDLHGYDDSFLKEVPLGVEYTSSVLSSSRIEGMDINSTTKLYYNYLSVAELLHHKNILVGLTEKQYKRVTNT
jgi:hypothetical protein